ncbi:MAG: choice-of-anchor Q domain-containing protein [Pirellulales bacterium]
MKRKNSFWNLRRRQSRQRVRQRIIESLEQRTMLTADQPGDDLNSAQLIAPVPGVILPLQETIGNGNYSWSDVDLYKVQLSAGDSLTADIDAQRLSNGSSLSSLDSHLRLFNAAGVQIASNADEGWDDEFNLLTDSKLTYEIATSGTYYIGVSAQGNEYYDPHFPGMGFGYSSGDYILKLLVTGNGAENHAPSAADDSFTVWAGMEFNQFGSLLTNDSDQDGNTITAVLQQKPSHGVLTALSDDGTFLYTPNAGYVGTDTFTYKSTDGLLLSNTATVTLNVSSMLSPDAGNGGNNSSGASTIVVNNVGDELFPATDVVTLRKALQLADSMPGRNTITFDLPASQRTIRLSQGLPLLIQSDVSIVGPTDGTSLTVTEADSSPHVRLVTVAAQSNATISDLMLTGGIQSAGDGGNIYNSGQLTLERVTLAGGEATIGYGGAVFNAVGATIRLRNVTVSGNSSGAAGGGIYNSGSLISTNSTITENTSTVGAGIATVSGGTLRNTLVSGNHGPTDVIGSFITNGHNLFGSIGTTTGLSPLDKVGVMDPRLGPLQDNGGSTWTHQVLVGSPVIDAGDNVDAATLDARRARRVLDGPEVTAPLDTVATVDIGAFEFGTLFVNSSVDAVDASPLGDGRVDRDPSLPGDQVTLRGAIQEFGKTAGYARVSQVSDQTSPNSPVRFEAFVTAGANSKFQRLSLRGSNELLATTGDLDIYGNVSIEGFEITGAYAPLQGPPVGSYLQDRLIRVHPGSKFQLLATSLAEGATDSDGALIMSESADVRIDHSTLLTSTYIQSGIPVANRGGGLFAFNSNVTVTASTIQGNSAFNDYSAKLGGGIYSEGGTLTVTDGSKLEGNAAGDRGGAIYLASGSLLVTGGSKLIHNRIAGTGAGAGGAIYVASGDATVRGSSRIDENNILLTGGLHEAAGIYNLGHLAVIEDSSVSRNGFLLAVATGIGIYNVGTTEIRNSHVDGNQGVGAAGIFNASSGTLNIYDSSVSSNISQREQAGGIHNDGGSVRLERTTVSGNSIDKYGAGAGIHNHNGDVLIIDSKILNNSLMGEGGGIYNFDLEAHLTVINSTINGNMANVAGGGVFNQFGTVTFQNSSISENRTGNDSIGGAGVYDRGENKLLAEDPGRLVVLSAAINETQSRIFVNDTSSLDGLALPLPVLIDGERMVITSVDSVQDALTVSRTKPKWHEVNARVQIVIDEKQTQLTLTDVTELKRYSLPLDVVINSTPVPGDNRKVIAEVVTVTSIDGNVVTVQRGRNGTIASEFPYPLQVWAVGGSLKISGSTISGNESLSSGAGVSVFVSPFSSSVVIENSTIADNFGSVGANLSTETGVGRLKQGVTTLSRAEFTDAAPNWREDATRSVFIQNTLISNALGRDQKPVVDVQGFIASGGGNLISSDEVISGTLKDAISPQTTQFTIAWPAEGLPRRPFMLQSCPCGSGEDVNTPFDQ